MLKRKGLLLLMLLCICTMLKGCDIVEQAKTLTAKESAKELLSDTSGCTMSESTAKIQEKLAKATSSNTNTWSKIPIIGSKINSYNTARVADLTNQYETALATDKVYQASKSASEDEGESSTSKLPYIILIVVVVVILVLVLLLRKRMSKPKRVAVKKETAPVLQGTEPAPVDDTKYKGRNVDYDKKLHEYCSKYNMNYNDVLNSYNGDVKKACEEMAFFKPKAVATKK